MTPDRPGIRVMTTNLLDTAKGIAQDVIEGNQILAEESEINRRKELCRTCEYIEPTKFRCMKCGCFMNSKAKIASANCPISKW